MKNGFRQSMAWLHTWTGLLLGWLLFAIFLTGTIAYFRSEVTYWMRPELHGSVQGADPAGLALARLASETVLSWGEQAFRDAEAGRITEAVERIIEANILLSGVGFEATNLAAAHSIHNGLTRIPRTAPYLHGEKVAFGILTGLVLNRAPEEELRRVYRFLNALQLPVTLEQLGLPELTGQEWEDLLDTACRPHSLIHNEPMEITRQGVREAMEEADARGKAFLGSSAETRS